jgi:transposase
MEQPSTSPHFVGIDVSKDRLDVHVLPSKQAFAVARNGEGLDRLAIELCGLAPALVVLEATGGFELTVAAALAGAGLPLAVVNPRQIRDFARATGRLAKTDTLDAEIIALFAERIRPEPRPVAELEAQVLAELVARRRQLVEMIGMESNRRRQARAPKVQRTLEATLKTLEAQLAELDREIDDTVRGSPAWRAADDLLTSVPGVGDITARTLIAELPELGRLDRRRIAAPGRHRPDQPRFRTDARPQGHRRRPDRRAQRPLHGNPHRHPMEPRHQGPLHPARRARQAKEGRYRRLHASPPRHPQRHHQDRFPVANRLTIKTVAHASRLTSRR